MERCPKCGANLRTLLLCEGCRELLEPARVLTPFEALGLEPGFALAGNVVHKRLL